MAVTDVKRYALLACAHMLAELPERLLARVRAAVLFGSVAAGTATVESDIDLFFDTDAPKTVQQELRSALARAADGFALSRAALGIKLRGGAREVSVIVGRLAERPELSRSIAANGIVLYGPYARPPGEPRPLTLLAWEHAGKARGALQNKFSGYQAGRKRYPGLLEKLGGEKVGPATILVPAERRKPFIAALERYQVSYARRDVWE